MKIVLCLVQKDHHASPNQPLSVYTVPASTSRCVEALEDWSEHNCLSSTSGYAEARGEALEDQDQEEWALAE